jgi:hypothetical protein
VHLFGAPRTNLRIRNSRLLAYLLPDTWWLGEEIRGLDSIGANQAGLFVFIQSCDSPFGTNIGASATIGAEGWVDDVAAGFRVKADSAHGALLDA